MAHYILLGDAARGLTYTPYALFEFKRMRQAGLVTGNRSFYPEKDVWIRVVLDPYAGDKIYISADEAPVVLNAFVDTYKKLDLKDNGRPKYQYLVDAQNTSEHRVPSVPPPIPPAVDPPITLHAVRLKSKPAELVNAIHIPVEPQTAVTQDENGDNLPTFPNQSTNKWREVFESFLPSKFTGHIRKTMQVAHAEGRWLDPLKVSVDYHYGNCFGLVKHNKKYWMLWIKDKSVWYVPSSISVTTDKDGNEIPRLVSMSKTAAVKIKDFAHDGTSWSTEIGWAFSYDKPEASIVFNGSIMQGISNYQSVSLATLTFTFDADTGAPNGATFAQTKPQIFWNPHFMSQKGDWGLFNVPVFSSEDGVAPPTLHNESVNFGRGRPAGYGPNQMPSGYRADTIPVYVFYSETKGQQLCTYSYEAVQAQGETSGSLTEIQYLPDYLLGQQAVTSYKPMFDKGWQGTKSVAAYFTYGFSCAGSSIPVSQGAKNHNYTQYNKLASFTNMNMTHSKQQTTWTWSTAVGNCAFQVVQTKQASRQEIEAVSTTDSGGDSTVDMSCALPVADRESVLLCQKIASGARNLSETPAMGSSGVYRQNDRLWLHDTFNTSPVVQWGQGVQLPVYAAAARYNYGFCNFAITGFISEASTILPWTATDDIYGVWVASVDHRKETDIVWNAASAAACTINPTVAWPLAYSESSYTSTSGTPVQAPRTTNTPASTTYKLTLFTGRDPIDIDPTKFQVNDYLFDLHPLDNSLAYKATQAAWSPKYVAYDIAPGTQNVSVVDMNGTKYNVERQLFGWIGAV